MCEKPLGADRRRGRGDGRRRWRAAGVPNTVWHNYRRVPGGHADQAAARRGEVSGASSTTARSSCRTGRSRRICRRAAKGCGGSTSTVAGSGVTGDLLAHNIDTALWLNGPITRGHGDDRDVHQGTQAQPDRQGRAGRDRRCERVPRAGSRTARWRCSRRRATRAGTRRSTRSRSTASTRRRSGICTTCIASSSSITSDEGRVRGWRNIHVTDGDQPYMKHWWVPGLQIGYEHTFIHQFADFVRGAAQRQEACRRRFRDGSQTDYVTRRRCWRQRRLGTPVGRGPEELRSRSGTRDAGSAGQCQNLWLLSLQPASVRVFAEPTEDRRQEDKGDKGFSGF